MDGVWIWVGQDQGSKGGYHPKLGLGRHGNDEQWGL